MGVDLTTIPKPAPGFAPKKWCKYLLVKSTHNHVFCTYNIGERVFLYLSII